MEPLAWIVEELQSLEQRSLRRHLATRIGPQGPVIQIDGRELINFGSNDYLGLAAAAEVRQAMVQALALDGVGAGASPLITGRGPWHNRLEERIAEFEGTEAALLFPTGFAANVGAITAVIGEGDVIFSDAKNHASIIDGCRLSRAQTQVYRHADANHAAELLAASTSARRRLIVTDSLFSMDGDLAPLDDLADIAGRYDAMLMVDEAHATGVFGLCGRGVCEHLEVEEHVDIRVGTLSKALGCHGGFVAGSQRLIDLLVNRSRPYIYSTACPGPVAAAAVAAIDMVATQPERRRQLLTNVRHLRSQLEQHGLPFSPGPSQIIPLTLGDEWRVIKAATALTEHGYFVPAIRPPTVPHGEALLRLSVCMGHEQRSLVDVARSLVRILQ